MELAIKGARKGVKANHGGPFGACVVRKRRVIAVAHNTVLHEKDPTCHAEINAIRKACRRLGNYDLSSCEIYSTAEPCPMCLAAIYWSRIPRVYIGVERKIAARHGFRDGRLYSEFRLPAGRRLIDLRKGVMRKACEKLFKEWKRLKRPLY